MADNLWSICLSFPNGQRQILRIDCTSSLKALYDKAQSHSPATGKKAASSASNKRKGKGSNTSSTTTSAASPSSWILLAGFPPKPLEISETTTLQDAGLRNQERITVQAQTATSSSSSRANGAGGAATAAAVSASPHKRTKAAPKDSKSPGKHSNKRKNARSNDDEEEHVPSETLEEQDTASAKDDNTTSRPTRQRRAAAQRATDSFADVIRAQDEAAAAAAKPRTRKGSTQSFTVKKSNNTRTNSAATTRSNKFVVDTPGRRLQDGATVASPRKRPRRQAGPATTNNPGDSSLALLETLESQSKAGRLMRQGWRKAVNDRYEQNKAVARLAAIPHAVEWRLEDRGGGSEASMTTTDAILHVSFAKGVQGRGSYEEQVDFLPRDVLSQVVASIHPVNPEALRPENLALLSPRVLWSTVYHFCQKEESSRQDQTNQSPTKRTRRAGEREAPFSMLAALQDLQPELDWSFLRRRKEELSAKARENLRQAQEEEADEKGGEENDWEAAAAAIASVETAMEQLETLNRQQRQARILQAIERRHPGRGATPVVFQVVTPVELDREELRECVEEAPLSDHSAYQSTEKLIDAVVETCAIHNWRELANSKAEFLSQRLGSDVDVEMVRAWIDRAQQESVDEIMVEVCDGNVEAVQLMLEHVSSGTPRDLAVWRTIPDELHRMLREKAPAEADIPSMVDLSKWCIQADHALRQLEWLGQYVTPLAGGLGN